MNPQQSQTLGVLTITTLASILFGIGLFISWIIAIIDVIRSDFEKKDNKIIWILLLLLLAPLGTILYIFIGKNQKMKYIKIDEVKDNKIDSKWF